MRRKAEAIERFATLENAYQKLMLNMQIFDLMEESTVDLYDSITESWLKMAMSRERLVNAEESDDDLQPLLERLSAWLDECESHYEKEVFPAFEQIFENHVQNTRKEAVANLSELLDSEVC